MILDHNTSDLNTRLNETGHVLQGVAGNLIKLCNFQIIVLA